MTTSAASARTLPGFDPIAARVLRHLVRQDGADAADITDALALDHTAVAAALAVLERERLVVRTDDGRWAPLPPRSGLATVLARRRAELAGWEQHIDALEAEYWSASGRRAASGLVEHVTGRDQVGAVYDQLIGAATQEVLHLAKPPYVSALGPFGGDASSERPGLSVRSIYDASGFADPVSLRSAIAGSEHGGEMRLHVSVPTKLVVVDRRVALLPRDDDASAGSVVVRVPGVVGALVALFESLWRSATPLERSVPARPSATARHDGLPGRAREVLDLMAGGLTDEAIAHTLGISRRTVQKTISELAVALGARTRFQIALVAAERGLVLRART